MFHIFLLIGLAGSAPAQRKDPSTQLTVAATHELSDFGSDHAAWYPQANKIVTFRGRTHAAWLDAKFNTMIATYDHASDAWSEAVLVGDGKDNHAGPALTVDREGYLHIVFGPHHHPFQHARSARPNDATEWVKLPDIGAKATYPSLVCDGSNTLHIIYRTSATVPISLVYQRLPKGGRWSRPRMLARPPEGHKGYAHFHSSLAIGRDDALHVSYNIWLGDDPRAGGHMKSVDRGDTWALVDGTQLELPITPDKEHAFFRPPAKGLKMNAMAIDSRGHPWITINVHGGPELHHHDGEAWRILTPMCDNWPRELTTWRWHVSVDPRDRVYLLGNLGPRVTIGDYSGGQGGIVVLRSTDRGQTFRPIEVLPSNEERPYTGLSIERDTGHNDAETPHLLIQQATEKGDIHKVIAARLQWPGE
jgi:hypothetical protein